MRIFFIILFLFIMVGDSVHAKNSDKTIIQTPLTEQNLSPDALFDQIRGFLTIPIPSLNISIPTLRTPDFDTSGMQNLVIQIREMTGVDIVQFFHFLRNIFLVLMRYLLDLLSRAAR